MADVTIGEMVHEIAEANGWRSFSQMPGAFQYFFLNVKPEKYDAPGLGVMSEAQYEKENPAWVKQMREDYAAILTKREADAKAAEAAKIAESATFKALAGLTPEQLAHLVALASAQEAAPAPTEPPAAPIEPPAPAV